MDQLADGEEEASGFQEEGRLMFDSEMISR